MADRTHNHASRLACGAASLRAVAWLVLVIVVAGAVAVCVSSVRGCRRAPEPPVPVDPVEAARLLTEERGRERMGDTNYMADLAAIQTHQTAAATNRIAAVAAFETWRDAWLATNASAKAAFDAIATATNAFAKAAAQRDFEALVRQTPEGGALLAAVQRFVSREAAARKDLYDAVGARLRQQAREHADEDAARAAEAVKRGVASGRIRPRTPPPANAPLTNVPPRKVISASTNFPPRAGVSVSTNAARPSTTGVTP